MINSFPFDVSISSGEIGGPSAGLMWALGLYDLLTPGDLTDGQTIAGTGQIALDGSSRSTASTRSFPRPPTPGLVFLVPQGNMQAARATGGHGLELVPIATFDDAIAYLHAR